MIDWLPTSYRDLIGSADAILTMVQACSQVVQNMGQTQVRPTLYAQKHSAEDSPSVI